MIPPSYPPPKNSTCWSYFDPPPIEANQTRKEHCSIKENVITYLMKKMFAQVIHDVVTWHGIHYVVVMPLLMI